MSDALPDNKTIARKLGAAFLYFAGFALIAGPIFHTLALVYEYVSHAYTFLTMDAALGKLAAQCREAVTAVQEDGTPHPFPNSCDDIPTSSGMTWDQYWERNPIGIDWHFFLGISPQILLAIAAIWGGYRLGHPKIKSAEVDEEMTPAQLTGLFTLVCGVLMMAIAYGFALAGGFKDPGPSRVVNSTFGESPSPAPTREMPQEYEIAKILAMIGLPAIVAGIGVRRYARQK